MEKTWDELTPAERRVAIATDAMQQAINHDIKLQHEAYFYIYDEDGSSQFLLEEDARAIGRCGVCARGALLVSRIAKFNSVTHDQLNLTTRCLATEHFLDGAFSLRDLERIECAYEMNSCYATDDLHGIDGIRSCVRFGVMHKSSRDRFVAICQNIIDNNGDFCPQKA